MVAGIVRFTLVEWFRPRTPSVGKGCTPEIAGTRNRTRNMNTNFFAPLVYPGTARACMLCFVWCIDALIGFSTPNAHRISSFRSSDRLANCQIVLYFVPLLKRSAFTPLSTLAAITRDVYSTNDQKHLPGFEPTTKTVLEALRLSTVSAPLIALFLYDPVRSSAFHVYTANFCITILIINTRLTVIYTPSWLLLHLYYRICTSERLVHALF